MDYLSTPSAADCASALRALELRFRQFPDRLPGTNWQTVAQLFEAQPRKLETLARMEATGGEPILVFLEPDSKQIFLVDGAAESPKGRRSCCFDEASRVTRKDAPPATSALELALAIGFDILDETRYRRLQEFGPFDAKTSSWIATPEPIRKLGGALFCDYRYGTVFTYHNGAQSYYAARGFRGCLPL
jgi:hypothetical protein